MPEQTLRAIQSTNLVIIYEPGYVSLDIEDARLLFQVMNGCYERRPMIIMTNIEFSKWGKAFADDKLVSATISRIVHHGRLVEFYGTSKQMDAAHAEEVIVVNALGRR